MGEGTCTLEEGTVGFASQNLGSGGRHTAPSSSPSHLTPPESQVPAGTSVTHLRHEPAHA